MNFHLHKYSYFIGSYIRYREDGLDTKIGELYFESTKKEGRIKPTFLIFGLSMIGEAREFEKKICFDDIVFQAEFQSTSHRLTRIKS